MIPNPLQPMHDTIADVAALRLGFTRVPCLACLLTKDSRCPNCDGEGDIWRSGSSTVARAGLMRLSVLRPDTAKPQ